MGINILQDTTEPTGAAGLVDDKTGGRVAHLAANARLKTTLMFKIDQTSPGIVQGMGGDTAVTIPGGAIPVALRVWGRVNDAVTGANISVGLDNVTSAHFLSGYNVADAPTGLRQQFPQNVTNLWAALPTMPIGQAHTIVGRYAVAATSSSGGPWYVEMDYYLPDPA